MSLLLSSEATASFELPVGDKNTEAAYRILQQQLAQIQNHQEDDQETKRKKQQQRLAVIEIFVRKRTDRVAALPWLQERLNPPPFDMPPCLIVPLPENITYMKHHCDKEATVALVPFAPPLEYFQNPPAHLYDESSDRDPTRYKLVMEILAEYGLDQLYNLAADTNTEVYFMTLNFRNTQSNIQIYATWARDTARDGVEHQRTLTHHRALNQAFHNNNLNPTLQFDKPQGIPEHTMVFPLPGDLWQTAENTHLKLETLLSEISDKIDNPTKYIDDYARRSLELFKIFSVVIDACRWHIEHDNVNQSNLKQIIQSTLVSAYSGLNTVLQICNDYYDNGERFKYFHDVADLVGGSKVDSSIDGRNYNQALPSNSADYFDAFMAVSQYREVAIKFGSVVLNGERFQWHSHWEGRSLFGNFQSGFENIRQQLTTMAILYLRMPQWQAEAYKDIIQLQFEALIKQLHELPLQKYSDEPLLFIPSSLSASIRCPECFPYNLTLTPDLFHSPYLNTLQMLIQDPSWTMFHFFQKDEGRTEVSVNRYTQLNSREKANTFVGLGSQNAWVDELGFVHPGSEKKRPVTTQSLKLYDERPKAWIEKIASVPSLLAESRLGKQTAETIAELLRRNKETGSVRTVSKFASMLERLLGRQPTEEEADFISLLQELSLINTESLNLNEFNSDELQTTLKRIKEGKANLSDLDEGSIIMLLIATSGFIPRELLVELVFKSYESTGTVLTLEAIMALEHLDDRRHFSLFGFNKKKPSIILEGRAHLKKLLDIKRQIDPEYDPMQDEQWREQANKLIKQITQLLKKNKTYDVTMRSTLIAVLTAKENKQLVARCSVDGELLTAFLKFVSPELVTYYTQTYGPEENMTLATWYQSLSRTKESGGESHTFNQTKWGKKDEGVHHTVADATAGSTYSLTNEELTWPKQPNEVMQDGEVSEQTSPHIYHHQQRAIGNCVTGGSHLHSTLAQGAGEIEYAQLANPDGPSILLQIINSIYLSVERRVLALDKFLLIQPRRLAMSTQADYNRGYTVVNLEKVIDLSRRTGRWNGAFFAANILRHAGFFTAEIRMKGNSLYDLIVRNLAAESQTNFDEALKNNQDFLTIEDLQIIQQARAKYLEDLATQALAQQKHQEEIERQHRQTEMKQVNHEVETVSAVIRALGHQLIIEDQRRQEKKQLAFPTLGYQATQNKEAEMAVRENEIVDNTKASASENPVLDEAIFESINPATSQRALTAVLTGPDGKQLTGAALTHQLNHISAILIKISYELTVKKNFNLKISDEAVVLPATQQLLEQETIQMAEALHAGFANNVLALGLIMPTFNPRAEFVTTNARQLN